MVRCLQLQCCCGGSGARALRGALLDTLFQLCFSQDSVAAGVGGAGAGGGAAGDGAGGGAGAAGGQAFGLRLALEEAGFVETAAASLLTQPDPAQDPHARR